MKQKDVGTLMLVVAISLFASWLIANSIFGGEENRSEEVEVVNSIDSVFPAPDARVFKDGYLNPTELIRIGGENGNGDPFESSN